MKQPSTQGLTWLLHSMNAFNGSGYADKSTPESYVASYRAYNIWKKRSEAVKLVDEYLEESYELACHLVNAREAGHTPNDKNYAKFKQYYNPDMITLFN